MTDLHAFSYNASREKLFKSQSKFPLVIILLILIIFFPSDCVLILRGEI